MTWRDGELGGGETKYWYGKSVSTRYLCQSRAVYMYAGSSYRIKFRTKGGGGYSQSRFYGEAELKCRPI